jgi:hypothetical protein
MMTTAPVLTGLAIALALPLASDGMAARNIPAGFEDLVEGQVEQLEVRLFTRSAGVVPVLVALDTVRLQDPAGVLQALDLDPAAESALLPALSAPLARNGHRACRHGSAQAGCGYLEPPDEDTAVSAIYDEGEGALRLFVARRWLPAPRSIERLHQASAWADKALLHQHVVNASGGRDQRALAVQGAGALGVSAHGHLAANWNFNQQHGHSNRGDFGMDNAYYRQDLDRVHYLQVGRMDRRNLSSPLGGTFGFGMLPLDRFDGLRAGSSQAYLDVGAAVQASPLTVLLARDARVDAFDGERLLQTYYLPAGINELDTRSYPFGSYGVTLRIYEEGVQVRAEQAHFDKRGDGADDTLQWFLQAGRRAERGDRDTPGEATVMAGLRLPVGPGMAVTAGALDMESGRYGELRLDLRQRLATRELRGALSAMRGSEGRGGTLSQLSFRRRASWNVHHQRLRDVRCRVAGRFEGPGCSDALSASMALPLRGGSVYLGYTRRQTWRAGPATGYLDASMARLAPPLFGPRASGDAQRSRNWQGSYSRIERWSEFSVACRFGVWRQRSDPASGPRRDRGLFFNLSLTRLQRGDPVTSQRRYSADVRQPGQQRPQISYSASQTLRRQYDDQSDEVSVDLRGDNSQRYSVGVSARLQNHMGHTNATVARHQQPGRLEMAYSATHSAAFALGPSGFYWGQGNGADAGLAVKVDPAPDMDLTGVAAELQVAGRGRQRLRIGERRLVPLPAYQLHRAELQDASSMDSIGAVRVGAGSAGRALFLAPGRLLTMAVPIEVTYTFIGRAQDLAGLPVPAARVLNAPVPATGVNGGFVVEFPRRERVLYLLEGIRLLHCPLQVVEQRMAVLMVGAVRCQPLDVAQLPADIREQPRVTQLLRERGLIGSGQTAQRGGER